jgi:hypothetical protein
MEELEIMVFKSGKYPQGEWKAERVKRMVEAYDPEKSWEAPGVVGHLSDFEVSSIGRDAEYADAWVKSLRMDGAGKVYALFTDLSSSLKLAVMERRVKYCSVEIMEMDKVNPELPPYLAKVAFLGRTLPAVPTTLIPAKFNLAMGNVLESEPSNEDKNKNLLRFFCRFSEPKNFNDFKDKNDSKKESPMTDEEKKLFTKMQEDLNLANRKITEFENQKTVFEKIENKKEATLFFQNLQNEGILPPALFSKTVELDTSLDPNTRKEFREIIAGFQKIADTTGSHFADKKKINQDESKKEADLNAKITAFQAEHKIATFREAAKILFAKNPELFQD